jgi:O-antigen/teichoic acid export membrane protein
MLRFGSTVVLGDALQLANYRMDLFILAAFVPISDIGVYAVAVSLAEMLWQLPHAVSRSIPPRIMAGQLRRSGVIRISLGLGVLAASLALIGWFLVVQLVEPVFGSDFQRVPNILAALLPGVVLIGATKPLAAWTLSCGFPNRNLKASAAGFGVVLVGNLLLVPRLGILGAALASTLAYTVAAVIVALMARGADYSPLRPPTVTT